MNKNKQQSTQVIKDDIYISDEQAMMDFGGQIADQFPEGGIVLLNGDLGAGKTTLVRGLLRHLGFQGIVKSPTYTLVEPYQLDTRLIYHFDLYRLGDPEELEYIGGRDYWDSNALCLIEWPEKAMGYLPKADLDLNIQYEPLDSANVSFNAEDLATNKQGRIVKIESGYFNKSA